MILVILCDIAWPFVGDLEHGFAIRAEVVVR